MERTSIVLVGMIVVGIVVGSTAGAQDSAPELEWKTAVGSYQGEYAYQVGQDLNPRVIIDGMRWTLLSVALKKDRAVAPDDSVDVVVKLGFENPTSEKFKIALIILLEDAEGHKVGEPLNLKEEKIGKGDTKTFEQKFEIIGSTLINTGKVYLLLELS